MHTNKQSLILIGMPGAGKSTLGMQLATKCERPFIDTDTLIEKAVGASLQDYLNQEGYQALRAQEEQQLLHADLCHAIVATGGSVVYSEKGMQRLESLGICVYLHIDLATLQARVTNQNSRGLAVAKGTTLQQLYQERLPLYESWATHTVDCVGLSEQELVAKLDVLYKQYCI